MKTSSIVASVLFGSMAAAAPMLHKRAYVTHTETLIQTEVTYTTVYADAPAAAQPTGAFFEQTKKASTAAAAVPTKASSSYVAPVKPSSVAPVAPVKPSSVAPVKPSSVKPTTQAPAPTTTQAPAPVKPTTTQAPAPAKPTTTPAAVAKPTTSAAAAAPVASEAAAPASGGASHSGGSMTIHPFGGALGSCGKPIADTDMMVALADDTYGASTYDVATGNPTNKWCGQKINITYKGKTVPATIMDKCAGCTNGGLDVSPALWQALTGTTVGDRLYGMTWTSA